MSIPYETRENIPDYLFRDHVEVPAVSYFDTLILHDVNKAGYAEDGGVVYNIVCRVDEMVKVKITKPS